MFDYLLEKIESTNFEEVPFKHLHIKDFFSAEHFEILTNDPQIKRPIAENTRELITDLEMAGYNIQSFAGSIVSVDDYINYLNDKSSFDSNLLVGQGVKILKGYGLTLRMVEHRSKFLKDLINFMNSDEFINGVKKKFGIVRETRVESAYQKNLTGYNLNPHPDMRNKALTYMANIYTEPDSNKENFHTHFMEFEEKYSYIEKFWRHNTDVETCWVPWEWCKTVKKTSQNNSISFFKPSSDTLHAVDIDYDHLKQQRNQLYGNLWFKDVPEVFESSFNKLDLKSQHNEYYIKKSPTKEFAKKILKKIGVK